jgi:NCS1 nucleoside transporter family
MDDLLFNDRRWPFMVAILALCLGWILCGCMFRVSDWSDWCGLSHLFPSDSSSFIWNLGVVLAGAESGGDGHHLVWRAKLYWRYEFSCIDHSAITDAFLGECVTLMIEAIWPSYRNLHNGLSASAGVDTKNFLSFFLFWLCSLPALWFPVHKVRHLFTVKAIYSPIAAFAFFGWAISRANGLGPIIHQSNTVHGSDFRWAMVKGIMSCIGNFAALIMNDPDFSRFARTPKDALWSQLFTIPFGFGVTSFIGIIVSSSSSVIFNDGYTWNPLDLLGKFLDGASSGQRFGIFMIATGFALAQLGTNISANSVSAGTDLTALMPRYLNIRRGSYICAIVGLAMCPVCIPVVCHARARYI